MPQPAVAVAPLAPLVLGANQPEGRFYEGGGRISAFRSEARSPAHTPEDWVASTTSVRGKAPLGMTRLADGTLLAEAIAADPLGWLGAEHVARFGSDPMLLVKLLDAGQRLPVHAHPDGEFAAAHLGAAHGKAEAWYLLSPGTVYIGLREDVEPARLRQLVDEQDTEGLLALLNAVHVEPGDTVWVPPGTLHAIGAGILLAEVQEPEDLSILLEWKGFELDGLADGHLDLGFDRALEAVTTTAVTGTALRALITRGVSQGPTLSPGSVRYFRLDRIAGARTLPSGLAIVIGLNGTTTLSTRADQLVVTAGMTVLVPAGAGEQSYRPGSGNSGDGGSVLVARPPLAELG
jgi:mannose-6-phosphate isomerase